MADPKLNQLLDQDRAAHDWFRFVLSFPPHLVRDYVDRFNLGSSDQVLDPFCGTGTTVVECKKLGIPSIGIEAMPFTRFAAQTKINWLPDSDQLLKQAIRIAETAQELCQSDTIRGFSSALMDLLIENTISPLPLHKVLCLKAAIDQVAPPAYRDHERLLLAKTAVKCSNLRFGPEVGVGTIRADAPVVEKWLEAMQQLAEDLEALKGLSGSAPADVVAGDARCCSAVIPSQSISAIICSPSYPAEKDYTRTTRLESVLLDFITSKAELQQIKKGMLRANTRSIYQSDDDHRWVSDVRSIRELCTAIEYRRVALSKTSGFERSYARVTELYFGGMARHLSDLRPVLRPGARLMYVLGQQRSYLKVLIRTGDLVAEIAQSLGYEVEAIECFRTRAATATKEQLREEIVILQWKKGI